MPVPPLDARIAAGIVLQQGLLRDLEAGGTTVVGWKAGLSAPAVRASLGLAAPLVGLLPDATRLSPGTSIEIGTWQVPRAEAEVAVRLGEDVPADVAPGRVVTLVEAIAPAIELVDLSPPPEDPTVVLAGNIYHRAWMTGAFVALDAPLTLTGRRVTVAHTGVDDEGAGSSTVVDALEDLTGSVGSVLAEVARIASGIGPGLRAGDVVILGAVLPPQPVAPGGTFGVTLDGQPPIAVSLR